MAQLSKLRFMSASRCLRWSLADGAAVMARRAGHPASSKFEIFALRAIKFTSGTLCKVAQGEVIRDCRSAVLWTPLARQAESV